MKKTILLIVIALLNITAYSQFSFVYDWERTFDYENNISYHISGENLNSTENVVFYLNNTPISYKSIKTNGTLTDSIVYITIPRNTFVDGDYWLTINKDDSVVLHVLNPDLYFPSKLEIENKSNLTKGESFLFNAWVKNRGLGSVYNGYEIKFYISTDTIADDFDDMYLYTNNNVIPPQHQSWTTHQSFPDYVGDYYIISIIDPNNKILETDESNNKLITKVTFQSFTNININFNQSKYDMINVYNLNGVLVNTVYNIAEIDNGQFILQYMQNNKIVKTQQIFKQ